jgi:hypothetical protein|tara:strand:- start:59 stop:571 length:513 start_codon:yes stop_codon:yes gene_type:complete
MGKNIQKVQDMLDGKGMGKIQVGYGDNDIHANRELGERYFDHDGKEWEKTNYGRTSVSKLANVGLGDNCSSCEKLIIKKWDKDVYKADGRCYHCQMNYELDLKFDKPIRWFAYRRLKDLKNMDAIFKDMETFVFEKHEAEKNEKIFDKSVANALANGEVEFTINKNKNIS